MDVQESLGRIDLRLRTRPKKEVVAFGKLMAALSMMKAKDALIGFGVEVYEDRTVDVPLPLLTRAVQQVLDSGGWRPDPGELLQACERERAAMRAALKFTPCEQCNGTGWDTVLSEGVSRVVRCQCWRAHQAKVLELGAGSQPLALPAARDDHEAA